MKSTVLIIVAVLLTNFAGVAVGGEKETLELGSFSIPDTPAFEILGVSPSSVSRPGSMRELGITLFSSSLDGSSFPKNLSIEFSPYWWSYHTDLTWDRFNPKEERISDNLLQTLGISLATTQTTTVSANQPESTGLGVGFRTSILKGQPSNNGRDAHENVIKVLRENADIVIPDDPNSLPKDAHGNRILEVDKIADATIQAALDAFRKANLNRVGWRVEIAGASAFVFPNDQGGQRKTKSAGAWLDTAYRTDKNWFLDQFDFLGVARYLYDKTEDGPVRTYDIGGRIIWISSKDDLPLAISAEYVHRFVSKENKQDTRKYSLIAEYRVDKTYSVFTSLGENYDPAYNGKEPFVTLFGINVAFGKGPVIKADSK